MNEKIEVGLRKKGRPLRIRRQVPGGIEVDERDPIERAVLYQMSGRSEITRERTVGVRDEPDDRDAPAHDPAGVVAKFSAAGKCTSPEPVPIHHSPLRACNVTCSNTHPVSGNASGMNQ